MAKRLIDAVAYRRELENEKSGRNTDVLMGIEIAIADLGDMPSIDAVEVVRCKDCRRCEKNYIHGDFIGYCAIRKDSYGSQLRVGLSDYCSDGWR